MIKVIQRVVMLLSLLLLARSSWADGLQDIRATLAYPRKEAIARLAERPGGDTVSALVLERTLVRKPAEAIPAWPCAQVGDYLRPGCILLASANAINDGRFDDLHKILSALDVRERQQLYRTIPSALLEILVGLPATRRVAQGETHIFLNADSEGYLQDSARPVLDIEMNGRKIAGTLDTGASITLVSDQDAQGLELIPLDYQVDISTYYRPGQMTARFHRVKQLKIGNTELSDVVVLVGGQLTLIGLDLVSKLDSLYVSSGRLSINSSADELARLEKECRVKVFLNSDFIRFNQFLYFTAKVAGKSTVVALDTGYSDGYLATATRPDSAERDALASGVINDARGPIYEHLYNSLAEIEVGSRVTRIPAVFSASRNLPAPYVLGWRGFSQYQLVYNVKSARACLI